MNTYEIREPEEEVAYRAATGALGRERLAVPGGELQLSWHKDGEYVLLLSTEHGAISSVVLTKPLLAALANLFERHAK